MKKLLSILILTCMLTAVFSGITLFEATAESGTYDLHDFLIIDEQGGGSVQPQNLSYSQENTTVTAFIEGVDYSDDPSYTRSDLTTYLYTSTEYSKSKPFGKSVTLNSGTLIIKDNAGDVCYYETISAGVYTFKNVSPKGGKYYVISNGEIKNYGTISPTGQVRMIDMGVSVSNVRDIGGWACDGGTVKYGKIIRGGDVSSADRTVLVERCGVKAELNLRGNETAYDNVSPLGSDIAFCRPNHGSFVYMWYWQAISDANKESVKECFEFLFDSIKNNRPIYFHCQGGNDRTGTFACLVEGLLGVSQYDCDKDYELSMNGYRIRTGDGNNQQSTNYKGLITAINALQGDTFAQKIAIWLVSLGLSITDINAFRRSMIDGNPTDLTVPLSVTKSVSNCVAGGADASATTIDSGSSYNITLTANSGYILDGGTVTVMMGGVDVTSQVYSNGAVSIPSVSGDISITATAVKAHSISKTLTHCSASGAAASATQNAAGKPYAINITVECGYTLAGGTVLITMGGTDITSSCYSNGAISIASVTGDVEVTVTAIPYTPKHTNLAGPTGADWLTNKRYGTDGTLRDISGNILTNYIPITNGDTIRIKGLGALDSTATNRTTILNSDKEKVPYYSYPTPSQWVTEGWATSYDYDSATDTVTIVFKDTSGRAAFARFGGTPTTSADDIIITINEAIDYEYGKRHQYDNACDTTCNICGYVRVVGSHLYDSDCDAECNECGHIRLVGDHVYDEDCDDTCNICGYFRNVTDSKLSGSNIKKSLSLMDNININIMVVNDANNDVSKYTGWKLVVMDLSGDVVDTITDWYMNKKGDRVWFAFKVLAKDIGTSYRFRIHSKNENGVTVHGEELTYSVAAYCDTIESGGFSTEMKTLATKVKDYGTAAVAVVGVGAGITAGAYEAYNASAGFDSKISGTNVKKSLSILNSINLNIKVINDSNNDISDYSDLKCIIKKGAEEIATITDWKKSTDKRMWCSYYISALDINTEFTIQITANDGTKDVIGEEFTYSVEQYCLDLKAATSVAAWKSFADSVIAYGTAAKAYFDSVA